MTRPGFGNFVLNTLPSFAVPLVLLLLPVFLWSVLDARADNINFFSDTLSSSAPGLYSNHTISFVLDTKVGPGGYIDFVPPPDFVVHSSSTFSARNVELVVNGTPRVASSTGSATVDTVTIYPGTPGRVRYTLNSTTGLSNGDQIDLLIGSQTSVAHYGQTVYSSSSGTTTLGYDLGIKNASTTGKLDAELSIWNGGKRIAYAKPVVFLLQRVGLGPGDTTEQIPPERFNGAPTGTVGGTTLSAELSVETNEFATCKYATTPGVDYFSMPYTFTSTGLIVHTKLLTTLVNETTYYYYVRCMDDEGNYNDDDYEITFSVLPVPEGEPNTTGSTTGDGTGSGDEQTGTDTESGGETGSTGNESDENTSGSSSGGGGSGGGGGGGTGGITGPTAGGGFESSDAPYESGDATVIINGYAFPRSTVTILVDGQIADTVRADSTGDFSITLDAIARGVYTFGVYATDADGNKSSTFSTSFSVRGARTSTLSNINVMPTVVATPDPVDVGSTVTLSGYSLPDANITVENLNDKQSASQKEFTTTSDSNGRWSVEVSTTGFTKGTYKARAKAETETVSTNFSDYTYYGVGQEADKQINADLNRDGKVNLVDFSILLFHWGSDGGTSDPPADINGDGTVSLTDFSIMLFNWTG